MLCIRVLYENFYVTDIVEHLYHTKIPEIQKAPTDKFLPKILYKNGKVSLLDTKNNKTTDIEEMDHSTDSIDN